MEEVIRALSPDAVMVGPSGIVRDEKSKAKDRLNRWRRECMDACWRCERLDHCGRPCFKAQKILDEKGVTF